MSMRCGARHPRDARRVDQCHDQHDEHRIAGEFGPGGGNGEQRQHEEGDADQRLEQPLEQLVDPAADIAGEQAEERRRSTRPKAVPESDSRMTMCAP